jgi:hypothetical protein
MEAGFWLTAYLVAALLASVIAGIASYAKNRHAGYWVVLAFLFPPLVLILLLLPKGRGVHYYGEPRDDSLD